MEFRYNYCIKHCALCVTNNLLILWAMIHILSWTTKKHQKTLSRPLHSKLKKIQGLFKDLHRNLRTFQGKMEFKDFSRLCKPWISSMKSIHWQLEWVPIWNFNFCSTSLQLPILPLWRERMHVLIEMIGIDGVIGLLQSACPYGN